MSQYHMFRMFTEERPSCCIASQVIFFLEQSNLKLTKERENWHEYSGQLIKRTVLIKDLHLPHVKLWVTN